MYFLFSVVSSRKKCPHVQQTMPTSQYARHALHCALGSTSSSSHSSVFPAVLITSCDSLLKGLNCRCCWRSLWSAFSLRMVLDLLNQILNIDAMWSFHCWIWHSWNVEVNVLLVDCTVQLVVRVKWCNVTIFFRNKLFFHYVCAWAAWLHRLPCSIVSTLNTNVFRQFLRFPRSIWRTKYFVQALFIDLVGTGRFSFIHKNTFLCLQVSDRSQSGLGLDWVGLESWTRWTSPQDCWTSLPTGCCSIVEPNWSFPLVQLWSCLNEIFGGGRGDKCDFSYKTSPVFNLSTFGMQ